MMMNCSLYQIDQLLQCGVFKLFISTLGKNNEMLLIIVLKGFVNLLKRKEILDEMSLMQISCFLEARFQIESLKQHPCQEIREESLKLLNLLQKWSPEPETNN